MAVAQTDTRYAKKSRSRIARHQLSSLVWRHSFYPFNTISPGCENSLYPCAAHSHLTTMSTTIPEPPPPPITDSSAENAAEISQTPISDKMGQDSNVQTVKNEGDASAKSKQASNDGLKNYFVSNLCAFVTLAKD